MPIKLSDLELKAKAPTLPASLPVFALSAPTLEERRAAIGRLGEHLKLGALRTVEFEHGVMMGSAQGDITYFYGSGGIWARDATASQGATDEFRKWEGMAAPTTGDAPGMLDPDASKRLTAQARSLLQPLGLLGKEVASESVQLDQVAQLDAKGKEIARGVGQAAVKFQYAVNGVPVRGAGAKTLAFAEPASGQARFAGIFHAWRNIGRDVAVKLPSLEEALGVGVLSDPELESYQAAGHKIQITQLDFVYLALPVFMRQSHLFPAFQVEGIVSEGKLGISFHFARYHHAVSPRGYAAADLYGQYLTMNPDGIRPIGAPQAVA